MSAAHEEVVAAGREFSAHVKDVERTFRRACVSAPSLEARAAFAAAFWRMLERVRTAVGGRRAEEALAEQQALLDEVGPILLRGELFSRAQFRPHGFPGDYRTFELIYALEADAGTDPATSAIPNCLAYVFSTITPPRAAWQRRHALAALIERRLADGPLRVLDVACGGSRYLRDVLARSPHVERLEALCVDQDPAAIAFLSRETSSAAPPASHRGASIEARCVKLGDLAQVVGDRQFDLAIASGLTDYLDDGSARALFALFADRLAAVRGSSMYMSNLMNVGLSPFCVDWIGKWPIVYRDVEQTKALLPSGFEIQTQITDDGGLILLEAAR